MDTTIKTVLNPNLDSIDWLRVSELFKIVGWGTRKPSEIRAAFEVGSVSCFIFHADQIIGFGRALDDGKYYALLVDVVVDPKFQGQRIGTQIIESLKQQLVGYEFVTLTAAPGKSGFYEKLGWKKQKSSYIWPKDEKQEQEHC